MTMRQRQKSRRGHHEPEQTRSPDWKPFTLDTSALEHEIELVSEMIANIDNYVPSSVEGLQDKLDAAQNALENAASQAEIDEATKTLREATT